MLDSGPFACNNWSVTTTEIFDDPLGKYSKSLKSNWLGFPWLFPKIISMCHNSQVAWHCFDEDKTDVPILFLINLLWPLFLLLLLGSICHLLLAFPTITSIGLPGDIDWRLKQPGHFFLKERDLYSWFLHIEVHHSTFKKKEVHHSHGTWFLTC